MARVRLHDVCKRFRGVTAVSGLSLDIADGELLVLVGPSGCGKTTALRMVAGLEAVSAGEIHIGERLVNELSPKDRDVAMVFQSYALYPHMTVRQNLEFGLRMRHMPTEEITARVEAAAEMLDLQGLLDRFPRAMSGGQRQRVAMGRAIVRRPALFLFDEPLSNLDAKLRARMRTELARLHAQLRTTSIYVTHDQVEAMTLADRIAVMKDGVLQQVGTPLALYEKPANRFVAGFLGTPAMNFVDGELHGADGALAFVAEGLRFGLPPRLAATLGERGSPTRIALGIRPSDIRVRDPRTGDDTDEGEVAIIATVEVCEPLGAESYLHLTAPCGPLVARVESHAAVGAGHQVALCLPRERLHFFDGVSDASLGC